MSFWNKTIIKMCHRYFVLFLIRIFLLSFVFFLFIWHLTSFANIPAAQTQIRIFFNNASKGTTIEDEFITFLRSARQSFDGAFYDISSERVADCLIQMHRKGVRVRLVMEADSKNRSAVQKMVKAGIPIVLDDSEGLMHNKFAVIDGEVVWTGSYNPVQRAHLNDNNAVVIHSVDLASRFLGEFNDMFERKLFGRMRMGRPFGRLQSLMPVINGDVRIYAFFSPRDGIEHIIENMIHRAHSRIQFMAFSFTSNRIADALIAKARTGVVVKGIMEARGLLTEFSKYMKLFVEGVEVGIRQGDGVMHHKVIIIDERIVITGSFNFSRGADAINDENILIIESEDVAQRFLAEFARIRNRCLL